MNPKDTTLKALLDVVDTKSKITDFVDSFKFAVETLNRMKASTGAELSQLRITFDQAVKDLQAAHLNDLEETKTQLAAKIDQALKDQEQGMNFLRDKVRTLQNGEDGEDGKDADEQAIIDAVLAKIPLPPVSDAYDDAEIQAQIDEHTKAIEELKTRGTTTGWGAHPLNIYNSSGVVVDDVARHIKFTGATTTRSSDGVVTVAITGAGFVGTQEKSTTTPNGSQQTFAFAHTPTMIYWNGALQTLTDDYTVLNLTITFTGTQTPQTSDKIINVYA